MAMAGAIPAATLMSFHDSGPTCRPQLAIGADHPLRHSGTMKTSFSHALVAGALVAASATPVFAEPRDGARDFDWEIGTWKTKLRRLQKPLAGGGTWVEYEGTSVVRKVWNGAANLVELDVAGPAGRIEGLSLRLYNPQSRQWACNFATKGSGETSPPTIGGFTGRPRRRSTSEETLNGRAILVRFVISDVTPDACRFEQAFSDDGGKTWEVNWIAVDTRVGP